MSTDKHAPLKSRLHTLWTSFDGTPIPGKWVGKLDAFILPPLRELEARSYADAVGLAAKADLHGLADIDGEVFAFVGVIHRGNAPAGESDVDRLFDAASAELANSLGTVFDVVPWLLSPTGITARARARLLEAGALFSGQSDVENLLKAFDIDSSLDE